MQVKLAVGRLRPKGNNMAHTHDLEWEVGSRRIICMYDGCDFVMEEKDIIAIIGNHAAQQSVQPTSGRLANFQTKLVVPLAANAKPLGGLLNRKKVICQNVHSAKQGWKN